MKEQVRTRRCMGLVAALVGCGLGADAVYAHEEAEPKAGRQEELSHIATAHPVTVGAGLTIVAQGTSGAAVDDSQLTYSLDLAIESDLGDHGTAFIYINSAEGAAVDTGAATGPNADDESVLFSNAKVAEAWYQKHLGERASLTVGKIDPKGIFDGNEVANDQTTQFLADAFVNNPAIGFPGYVGGLALAFAPSETWGVRLGLFEPGEDFKGNLSHNFAIVELGLTGDALGGGDGHLRLIAWNDDAADNKGAALSADQMLGDTAALFVRYGIQEDTQDFDSAASIGGRWESAVGEVGAAYSVLASTGLAGPENEQQAEVYVSYPLNDNVHLSADVQWISNPGFRASADDVTVYGLRAQIDL